MNIDLNSAKSQSNLDKMSNISSAKSFNEQRADKVASDFEEMIFGHFIKDMFEATEGSSMWGEGHGAEIMKSLFIDALAKSGGAKCLNLQKVVKKNFYAENSNDNKSSRGKIVNACG